MKEKKLLRILYVLSVVSIFLPWFTYNPNIMGYCWGYFFVKWFAVPQIIIGLYLFGREKIAPPAELAQVCMVGNLAVLAVALGKWQEVCNIIQGFHWEDGFHTALPTFWAAVAIFTAMLILFAFSKGKANFFKMRMQ